MMINSKGTTHCICIAWTVKHRFSNMTPLFNLCNRGIRLPGKQIPPSARWHSDAFWGHVITILAWKPEKS